MEAVRLYVRPFTADLRSALKFGTLVACWQVQSKLAALTLFALVAVSFWWALLVMLPWSLAATCAYYTARRRGLPDILGGGDSSWSNARRAGTALGQLWLVGINAFVFVRLVRPVVERTSASAPARVSRSVVLLAGLTLFGVTITQHMLYQAGYRETQLLLLGLVGSFLNVPFRIFCGALTMFLVLEAIGIEAQVPVF